MAAWRAAGTRPPVVFLVQGSRVRKVSRSPSTALQVTMIVFVDMHPGPVYLQPDIQMRMVLDGVKNLREDTIYYLLLFFIQLMLLSPCLFINSSKLFIVFM